MATTVGELNIKMNLELQRLEGQINSATASVAKMRTRITKEMSAASKAVSKEITGSMKSMVFGALGAGSAMALVSKEIKDVIKNIDSVPGIDPGTIDSVSRMKDQFTELEAASQSFIAKGLDLFSQTGQGIGYGLGAMFYGWEDAVDAYGKTASQVAARKDLEERIKGEAEALKFAEEQAKSYSTQIAAFFKATNSESVVGESTGAQIKRLQAEAAGLEADASKRFGGFSTAGDRASGGEGAKLYAEAATKRAEASRLQIQLDERALALGEAQKAVEFERLDLTEQFASISAEILAISEAQKGLDLNDPAQFEASLEMGEKFLELQNRIVEVQGKIAAGAKDISITVPQAASDAFTKTEADARELQREITMMWNSVSDRGGQAFADILLQGENTFAELPNIVARSVTEIAARMALLNPILNMFGAGLPTYWSATSAIPASTTTSTGAGLLHFADGGSPPVGRPSWVGEEGPELFVPKSSGMIIPNHKLDGIGGGGGGTTIFQVDMRGASVEAVVRLEQYVRSIDGTLERRAIGAVANERRRGGGAGRGLGA